METALIETWEQLLPVALIACLVGLVESVLLD